MKKERSTDTGFDALIIEFLTGSVSAADLQKLNQVLQADPENRRHFHAVRNAWISSGKPVSDIELDLGWTAITKRLDTTETPKTVIQKRGFRFRLLPLAASWLLFLAAGALITWLITQSDENTPEGQIVMSVPLGARSHVKMPDGTGIWLNAGTTITYEPDYGKNTRTIELNGEAFFDVAKDKVHPFIVHTSSMDVHAVGTRFNVKAYADEKTVAATLEEGIIDVKILDSRKRGPISLNENEKIILLKNILDEENYTPNSEEKVFETDGNKPAEYEDKQVVSIISNVNTQLYTSWKDDRWIIQGEELATLAPMFERRFNIRIIFGNESLKKYKFTGTIENETVDQLLDLLTLTAPIEYKIDKDLITLNLNKRNILEFGKTMTRSN